MQNVEIIYHGHSMFEIKSESGTTIVTDPYNERIKSVLPDVSADIVLVSHGHFDHANVSIVKGNPAVVDQPAKTQQKGIDIEGIMSSHDTQEGKIRGKNIIFKFKVDGITFVHMGDLGHNIDAETIEKLKDTDILMLPVGGTYTINAYTAADIVNKLAPPVAIPMHYKETDSKLDVDKVDGFLAKYESFKMVGHSVKVSKEELTKSSTRVWVFDSK